MLRLFLAAWGVWALFLADFFSKKWVTLYCPLQHPVPIFSWLTFYHVNNRGAAFGLFTDRRGWTPIFLLLIAFYFLIFFIKKLWSSVDTVEQIALVFLLAGLLGNGVDRLFRGYVIDFIHIHWGHHNFPTFNVADVLLTLSVALLFAGSQSPFRDKG